MLCYFINSLNLFLREGDIFLTQGKKSQTMCQKTKATIKKKNERRLERDQEPHQGQMF